MNRFLFLLFLLTFSVRVSMACTSIVVSGKASADGRPFILKNGDATGWNVVTAFFQGERYFYTAVVTAKDYKPDRVRSGFNEKGFSIINTNGKNNR